MLEHYFEDVFGVSFFSTYLEEVEVFADFKFTVVVSLLPFISFVFILVLLYLGLSSDLLSVKDTFLFLNLKFRSEVEIAIIGLQRKLDQQVVKLLSQTRFFKQILKGFKIEFCFIFYVVYV